jgi:hypothetical protein
METFITKIYSSINKKYSREEKAFGFLYRKRRTKKSRLNIYSSYTSGKKETL